MNLFRKAFLVIVFSFFGNSLYCKVDSTSLRWTYFQEGGVSFYYSGYAFAPSLSYWFRFNFYEFNEFASLSLSAPLSASGYFSTYSGGYLMVDLPVTADFNFGNHANDITDFPIGGFLGVGAGFNYMFGFGASRSYGPLLHAGLRTSLMGRKMTLRLSYLIGPGGIDPVLLRDDNPNVLGLGIFFSL
jgi:hypothetical protein